MINHRHILYSMFFDMQKQTHEAFVSPDGNAAAIISPGKPLWFYPGENSGDEAVRLFFYSCLQRLAVPPVGIIAPENAEEICAEACVSVYGGECFKRKIIAYYLKDVIPNKQPLKLNKTGGAIQKAGVMDSALITGWLKSFYAESFDVPLPFKENPAVQTVNSVEKIENMLFIWRDVHPAAMGMLCCGSSTTARLNLIYTPPEFRRRGYGSAVVRELSEMAVNNGKVPVLYTGADNSAANALYLSLGFTEAGRLTEIILRR